MTEHPGRNHEFQTTCRLCGESGHLFLAVITDDEDVRIQSRAALAKETHTFSSDPDMQRGLDDDPDHEELLERMSSDHHAGRTR